MTRDEMKAMIARAKRRLRVTKVVATRSMKSKRGDFFAGFAATWDTVQDDAGGHGADMDLAMDTTEIAQSGMTLDEAVVSHNLLAVRADSACFRHARANGALSDTELEQALKATKHNHARALLDHLVDEE
jgi:hypothetical protein